VSCLWDGAGVLDLGGELCGKGGYGAGVLRELLLLWLDLGADSGRLGILMMCTIFSSPRERKIVEA
jgi:hypothetical protein